MRRAVVVFAGLGLLVMTAGCGDDAEDLGTERSVTTTSEAGPSTTALADAAPPESASGALEIALVSDTPVPAGPHTWVLELTNVSDAPVTVTFPTSQRGDVVLASDSEPVHRWSDERFFQQQISESTLEPGAAEAIELEDDLSAVEPGFYDVTVSASVVGPPEPVTESVRIVSP